MGLRRDLGLQHDIEKHLEALRISDQNIDAVRQLVANEGWHILACSMEDEMVRRRGENFHLSIDPRKNINKIRVNYAIVRTFERILSIVEGVLSEEKYVKAELDTALKHKQGDKL